jgi:hypothetical protein
MQQEEETPTPHEVKKQTPTRCMGRVEYRAMYLPKDVSIQLTLGVGLFPECFVDQQQPHMGSAGYSLQHASTPSCTMCPRCVHDVSTMPKLHTKLHRYDLCTPRRQQVACSAGTQ